MKDNRLMLIVLLLLLCGFVWYQRDERHERRCGELRQARRSAEMLPGLEIDGLTVATNRSLMYVARYSLEENNAGCLHPGDLFYMERK